MYGSGYIKLSYLDSEGRTLQILSMWILGSSFCICAFMGESMGTEYEALQREKKRSHERENKAVRKGDGEGNSTHWKGEY